MKKLVVIGGGFIGSHIAKRLESKFDVTLIDQKDYFEYTPGILRTIVQPAHIRKLQSRHSHYLRKSKIVIGSVTKISNKEVFVGKDRYKFDYLVISSGSKYSIPIKHQKAVMTTRADELRDCYEDLCKAKKVAIIGGGLVGVELAAEISERYKYKEIFIYHSRDKLLVRNNQKSINHATKFLEKRGVKIIYNTRTDENTPLDYDMVFVCTGIKTNYEFMKENFKKSLDEKNRIIVNEFFQVNNSKNIFAGGDVSFIKEEKTAQNAEAHAETIEKNIIASENNSPIITYQTKRRPMVISLGKYNGIFEYNNTVITGILPALLKAMIEKMVMWKH